MNKIYFFLLLSAFLLSSNGKSQNATIPGVISTPYPTFTCLAIEWLIEGDNNHNGLVEVSYRQAGEEKWLTAMPLMRVPAGSTEGGTRPTFTWRNKHSGSIFNLQPDTEYEIHVSLNDPDGGKVTEIITARTRAIPREADNSRIVEVNPETLRQAAMCAEPGDVLLLSPGYYGSFSMLVDGEPDKPIVLRADNAHPVIGSTFESVELKNRKNVIIDGLTVWGPVQLLGAENVAVRYCKVESQYGIIAKERPGCKNCYIADNTVSYKMPWVPEGIGHLSVWGGTANVGEGIEITGPGNVICYNRVSGFRDGISTMEDLYTFDQFCIDIYNNDISECVDDGIEADFCMGNCRIMNNRITNCGMGLSSQPGLGGPTYFIRNVMYNLAMAPFKLSRGSYGDVLLHNTVIKSGDGLNSSGPPTSRTVWLNNLCIGGPGEGRGKARAVALPRYNATIVFDYNAVGAVNTAFSGIIGDSRFNSIEELHQLTGGEHSVQVDMDVFSADVEFPETVFPKRYPQDLRIARGSIAEDAALLLPNINDDFTGKAPDIGAYEIGKPLPHYGPRSRDIDENVKH